jgi:hypothetical protein
MPTTGLGLANDIEETSMKLGARDKGKNGGTDDEPVNPRGGSVLKNLESAPGCQESNPGLLLTVCAIFAPIERGRVQYTTSDCLFSLWLG